MLPADVRYSLTLAPPAAEPFVVLDEAKQQTRVDSDDDDTVLQLLVDSAIAHLDGADGILGRALVRQSWQMRLDTFGNIFYPDIVGRVYNQILIPLPPLLSIDAITYVDVNGVTQTVDPETYQIVTGGNRKPALIVPSFGNNWPTQRAQIDAVQVAFTAGYGDAEDVPAAIRHAALMLVAHWYENREAVIADNRVGVAELPMAVDRLLAPFRAVWF